MGFPSLTWALPSAREARGRGEGTAALAVARALDHCGSSGSTSVLVVVDSYPGGSDVLRLARQRGARVTAFCSADRAPDALAAGAEFVMEATRTDPTWYRGAWSVIVDPAGRFGFRRAQAALGPRGVYLTAPASAGERARALLSRLRGGPRLARLPR
jgi:hypothetical protein